MRLFRTICGEPKNIESPGESVHGCGGAIPPDLEPNRTARAPGTEQNVLGVSSGGESRPPLAPDPNGTREGSGFGGETAQGKRKIRPGQAHGRKSFPGEDLCHDPPLLAGSGRPRSAAEPRVTGFLRIRHPLAYV